MRIEADRERCIGAGMCVLTAPDVFDQSDDDGRVVVSDPTPAAGRDAVVRQAAVACPAGAITVAGSF